jgi:hypothetical protein
LEEPRHAPDWPDAFLIEPDYITHRLSFTTLEDDSSRLGAITPREMTRGSRACTLDAMRTPGHSIEPLFEPLRRLRNEWPQRGWSWDSRVACVSSSFSVDLEQKNRALALASMATEYTSRSIVSAPPAVRDICDRAGGIRSGQSVFVGTAVGRIFPYGLWWPWGDGMTISLRVGLGGIDESHDLMNKLREVFGVTL